MASPRCAAELQTEMMMATTTTIATTADRLYEPRRRGRRRVGYGWSREEDEVLLDRLMLRRNLFSMPLGPRGPIWELAGTNRRAMLPTLGERLCSCDHLVLTGRSRLVPLRQHVDRQNLLRHTRPPGKCLNPIHQYRGPHHKSAGTRAYDTGWEFLLRADRTGEPIDPEHGISEVFLEDFKARQPWALPHQLYSLEAVDRLEAEAEAEAQPEATRPDPLEEFL